MAAVKKEFDSSVRRLAAVPVEDAVVRIDGLDDETHDGLSLLFRTAWVVAKHNFPILAFEVLLTLQSRNG